MHKKPLSLRAVLAYAQSFMTLATVIGLWTTADDIEARGRKRSLCFAGADDHRQP